MDEMLKKVIEEVSERPMRSSIITASALMDTMLEQVLKKYLIECANLEEIFSFQGCLGTFSSKIEMSYALGIISKELRDDLNMYRKIRNKCAHNITITDQTLNEIKGLIGNFNLLKNVFIIGENEDLLIYTSLEFAVIFVCLIKRLNNIERLKPFDFEVHDDYLAFKQEDIEFLSKFSETVKRKK